MTHDNTLLHESVVVGHKMRPQLGNGGGGDGGRVDSVYPAVKRQYHAVEHVPYRLDAGWIGGESHKPRLDKVPNHQVGQLHDCVSRPALHLCNSLTSLAAVYVVDSLNTAGARRLASGSAG